VTQRISLLDVIILPTSLSLSLIKSERKDSDNVSKLEGALYIRNLFKDKKSRRCFKLI
jgi:hypothetical protein